MSSRLYVGNIPYQMSDEELQETFARVGAVTSVKIITDSVSGRSKGFGFVELETEELAQQAIEELNGSEVGGRSIKVAPARPPRERNPRGGREFGSFNR